MAGSLVSFVLEQLATVIKDEVQQEVRLVVGVQKEINKLIITFKAIQAVLRDAEQREVKDELVRLWLAEFKDVAYDMDDVLDEWSTKMLMKSQFEDNTDPPNIDNKKVRFLCSLGSCFSKVALRHDIGSRIKKIRERLDFIVGEKNKYRLIEIRSNDEGPERLESGSLIDISDVYGRTFDRDIIIGKLLNKCGSTRQQETSYSDPIVISIVGMGGLGKTTLAQLVFNDEEVQTQFDMNIWVCVSDPFDLKKIANEIIQESGNDLPSSSEWNALHKCLLKSIKDKKFFIVLDDVWNDVPTKWEPLQLVFRSGAQGSRILLTTRNEKAAKIMNTTYIHDLKTLSDDDCWSLLRRIAFLGRKKEEQDILSEIGAKIASKCKGLPLAAKILGSLLHLKTTEEQWRNILTSEIWKIEEVGNSFLKPALLLSYYDLPAPLKSCFTYCSIFPKDHKMRKDLLIKLWMAQGFLNSHRRVEMESIGEEYFNKLLGRSFFQDLSKDDDGNIIGCKMHDVLHDFAQFLTNNECYIAQDNNSYLLNCNIKIRHLTLAGKDEVNEESFLSSIYKARRLRTFQLSKAAWKAPFEEVESFFFHNLRCLRTLCFSHIGIENLSMDIGKLIHLRYLDLSGNDELEELPDSITNLYNLQTLKLKECRNLCKLPEEMWRMIHLRHLIIRRTSSLRCLPQGFGKLASLQTLNKFIVSDTANECKIEELRDLIHLKGKLKITGLDRVSTIHEATEAELHKKKLHVLIFDFKNNGEKARSAQDSERMNGVLDGLKPHQDLLELQIWDYLASKFPSWMASNSALSHLHFLALFDCANCIELPALGQLKSLAKLQIYRFDKLKHIGPEFYCGNGSSANNNTLPFPKLKDLGIGDMNSLEIWDLIHQQDIGESMPCLRHLEIDCQKLKEFPALWKLAALETLHIKTTGEVKHIRSEFHGNGCTFVNRKAFPALKELRISERNLEVWEFGVGAREIMPCLQFLDLDCPKMKALPALGELKSLEVLVIRAQGVKQIGLEFYRNRYDEHAKRVAFPSLRKLMIPNMDNLEEWELGDHGEVMPCLSYINFACEKLTSLPAFGRLPSLENLVITRAREVKRIGCEFYGIRTSSGKGDSNIAFPMLKKLNIVCMENLEEWDFGVLEDVTDGAKMAIMPSLREVRFHASTRLKTLRALAKLPSLEILHLVEMDEVIHIGLEFYGLGVGSALTNGVKLFPKLKELHLHDMNNLEEWENALEEGAIMPCLGYLDIQRCRMLKSLPNHLLSLETLHLSYCSSLSQLPSLPKLKHLTISSSDCSTLPQGLAQLKGLQKLHISDCASLICMPEDVKHLSNIQELFIEDCGILQERCRKSIGEDWKMISHITNIFINEEKIQ